MRPITKKSGNIFMTYATLMLLAPSPKICVGGPIFNASLQTNGEC